MLLFFVEKGDVANIVEDRISPPDDCNIINYTYILHLVLF
jgi:hypothetical protein